MKQHKLWTKTIADILIIMILLTLSPMICFADEGDDDVIVEEPASFLTEEASNSPEGVEAKGFLETEGDSNYNNPAIEEGTHKVVEEGFAAFENVAYAGIEQENTLVLDDDGAYRVYNNGVFTPMTGFIEYQGGLFFVANGVLNTSANGLVNDPDNTSVWYFCAGGQVALSYSSLAEYGGEWFYLSNGVLDTTSVGIVNYNGGRFMIAAGRILKDVNGLIQDPNTGLWYYVSAGQVVDYTGLALYNGSWFYVVDGMLAVEYIGLVHYNGSDFYVVNGQVAGSYKNEIEEEEKTDGYYVLNTNTQKFHYPSCRDVPKIKSEHYQVSYHTRDAIIAMGYSPCGHCNP